jgi:protein-L-isoaspartate O-methyltransferase
MANISKTDKILHIGCGAIPYTSIILSREYDVEVIGIDNQIKTITQAKKFLKKVNLSNKIHIEIGDGETYDTSNFDIIIMSYGIGNIEKVLRNVFENLKSNSRIIMRWPITEKNDYVYKIILNYSIKNKRLLLTQDSFLIMKKIRL